MIRARSRLATITDGHHVKTNYWFIMPDKNPDVYYVEVPLEPHAVTLTTDLDSIRFDVTYGARHAFVVQLDDGRAARTEIRAEFKNLLTHELASESDARARVIPFRLGDNDKIYVQGRVNGSAPMSLQFDLGAGGSLIKESAAARARMAFDGTITLRNSDGVNEVRSSSRNELAIGAFVWRNVPFAVAGNLTHREDAIVGNGLFLDQVVEIDYGRMAIVVHDARPPLGPEWRSQDMFLDGGTVPFTRSVIGVGDTTQPGWLMMDTGAYTSILNSPRLFATTKMTSEVRRLLGPLGGTVPQVTIAVGGETFSGINYSRRAYDGEPSALGLLGNDILKRFDLVIDNRAGVVFLRPNHQRTAPFRNPERLVVRLGAALVLLSGLVVVWWRRRDRVRSARTTTSAPGDVGTGR